MSDMPDILRMVEPGLSAETAAFITGGAGLAGAVPGSLSSGASEYVLGRLRRKTKAKVGARMIRSQLATVGEHLAIAEAGMKWRLYSDTSVASWDTYGDALADRLDQSDWARRRGGSEPFVFLRPLLRAS